MSSKETESLDPPRADVAAPPVAPAQLASLARGLMVPSHNVRTHFDEAWIKELAGDIKARGILQPLLVRPLPASRLQETFEDTPKGAPRPTHEIVDGECRWRAGDLIDLAEYPVLIRHLTDVEVVQVQLVASLRRRNLHPLEEAEGFERLRKDHGQTLPEIAASIEKSESYVHKSLKLLELTEECRKELYAGKLTQSTALLVARAPDYLQAKVAKDIMTMGQEGEPMSYRTAVRHIHQHYMLQLAHAVFDIKDASLVAKAGSCGTCAKNTGANGDMFEDVKNGDTCTDPKCFDSKKVAHFSKVAKAAEAKGQKVIQGKEAKELIEYEGATPTGYRLLDDKDYINNTYTSLRKVIGKDAPTPVLIIDPFTKVPVEALPIEVADKLIKQADRARKVDKKDAEPSKADLEHEFQQQWKDGALRQIGAALLAGKMQTMSVAVARHIALALCGGYVDEVVGEILELDKVGRGQALEDFIKTCPANKVAPTLLILMLEDELDRYDEKEFPATQLLAKETGVDLNAVKDQVKTEMRDAAAARKAAAQAKADKGKKPTPAAKAKPKKTTAADAKAGISKALQAAQSIKGFKGITDEVQQALAAAGVTEIDQLADLTVDELVEISCLSEADSRAVIMRARETWFGNGGKPATPAFAVGDRVRFKEGLKGPTGKARKVCGREGTVDRIQDNVQPPTYGVRTGPKGSDYANARADELEPAATIDPKSAWPFPNTPKPASQKAAAK